MNRADVSVQLVIRLEFVCAHSTFEFFLPGGEEGVGGYVEIALLFLLQIRSVPLKSFVSGKVGVSCFELALFCVWAKPGIRTMVEPVSPLLLRIFLDAGLIGSLAPRPVLRLGAVKGLALCRRGLALPTGRVSLRELQRLTVGDLFWLTACVGRIAIVEEWGVRVPPVRWEI